MRQKFLLCMVTSLFLFLFSAHFTTAQDVTYPPMAVVDAQGQLWLYGFAPQPQRTSIQSVGYLNMTWSPDGSSLAVADAEKFILIDSNTLKETILNGDFRAYGWFPISFSQDGKQLIYAADGGMNDWQSPDYWLGYWAVVYSLELNGDAQPEEIGYVDYDDSFNGLIPFPADVMYWSESWRDRGWGPESPGNDRLLLETPFGILHTQGLWGSGIVKLFPYGSERNKSIDLPGNPYHVVVSPDRTQIVGASEGRKLVKINLETMESRFFSIDDTADVVAWNGDENVYFVTRNHRKDLLDTLSNSAQQQFHQNYPYFREVPRYDVQIRVLNLENGQSEILYEADAYAIGRLMVSPDDNTIFFTQIPNMESWISRLLRYSKPIDEFDPRSDDMAQPTLYELSLEDNHVEPLGTGLYQATINFPVYEQQK